MHEIHEEVSCHQLFGNIRFALPHLLVMCALSLRRGHDGNRERGIRRDCDGASGSTDVLHTLFEEVFPTEEEDKNCNGGSGG